MHISNLYAFFGSDYGSGSGITDLASNENVHQIFILGRVLRPYLIAWVIYNKASFLWFIFSNVKQIQMSLK